MVACQEHSLVPSRTETVIIGNGPSALFLSWLLHGHVPYYRCHDSAARDGSGDRSSGQGEAPLSDRILDRKLRAYRGAPLYDALKETDALCEHFEASGRYSSDAWPINVLLDALLVPDVAWDDRNVNNDDDDVCKSKVDFQFNEAYRHDHVVFGTTRQAGGQWADSCSQGKENGEVMAAKTLSYGEQLSLPGYTFAQHYRALHGGQAMPNYERPQRQEITSYYATYPSRVGIQDALWNGSRVESVCRNRDGKYTVSGTDCHAYPFTLECRNVVLACGLFTELIEPPDLLLPYANGQAAAALKRLPPLLHHRAYPAMMARTMNTRTTGPSTILIIGSGFSAADAIVENLGHRRVVHLYKWHSAKYVSPLKHCHSSAYPEYADVYRRMKLAAQTNHAKFIHGTSDYEGYADVEVTHIRRVHKDDGGEMYTVTLEGPRLPSPLDVCIDELTILAGRRTSLDFLSRDILQSLEIDPECGGWAAKTGLRDQITPSVAGALTVDEGRIACIGSITGDSLVKFMFGGAIGAAGYLYGL